MNPHQRRDLLHWKAFARVDGWSVGWKHFHQGLRLKEGYRASAEYYQAQQEAVKLAAACAVTPKGPRAT